jgi:hypothetical protein
MHDFSFLRVITKNVLHNQQTEGLFSSQPDSEELFLMTRNYMTEAFQILDTVQDLVFPDQPGCLHPYTILTALLTHAPAEKAQEAIAKDIVENTTDGDVVTGLMTITNYWWTTLLVPCNSLLLLQFLLMKSAD